MIFNVKTRDTQIPVEDDLTAIEVVDTYGIPGERSAALVLLRNLRAGQTLTIGGHKVEAEASRPPTTREKLL